MVREEMIVFFGSLVAKALTNEEFERIREEVRQLKDDNIDVVDEINESIEKRKNKFI